MKKHDYLICYDIADPKRLARIAKYLEREAIRIQYSIFLAKGATKESIYTIAQNLVEMIEPKQDDVRIYEIEENTATMGKAYNVDEIFIINH